MEQGRARGSTPPTRKVTLFLFWRWVRVCVSHPLVLLYTPSFSYADSVTKDNTSGKRGGGGR